MTKAFILCRQSSTDGDESTSIEVQEEACRRLCRERGAEIVEVFREPDTSGRLYPAGHEALAALDPVYQGWIKETKKQGKWRAGLGAILRRLSEVDFVAVYDMTRLHRPLIGGFSGQLVTSALVQAGVKILSVREGLVDMARFGDRLVSDISSAVNSDQLMAAREKAKASNRRLRDEGKPLNALRTIGLKYINKRTPPEIEPKGAEIVRKIICWVASGMSIAGLCKELQKTAPGMRPSGIWYPESVRRIIRNPSYAGLVRKTDGSLAETSWIPALVDRRLWRLANSVLERQKARPTKAKRDPLPASGLLVDGYSGERMAAQRSRRGRIFYRSMTGDWSGRKTAKPVTWSMTESYKGEAAAEDFFRPLCWHAWSRAAAEALAARSGEGAKAREELEKLKARRAALSKALAEGLVDETEALAGLKRLKAEIASLEERTAAFSAPLEGPALMAAWDEAKRAMRGEVPPGAFRRLLLEGIERVVVWNDRVEVFMAAGGSWTCPRLIRGTKGNRASFPRHELDAELAEGHVAGDRSPFGMRLVIRYLAGGGEEKTVWSDPWTRIVVK